MEWENLTSFIADFNNHICGRNLEEDMKFFDLCELEMAKAFLHDNETIAVRVSKIILALKDVNDIKIKIQ